MIGALGKIASKMFKNDAGQWSKSKMFMGGMNAYMGISEYEDKRQEGNGMLTSALSAAGDVALGSLSMPLMLAKDVLPAVVEGGIDAYDKLSAHARSLQKQDRNTPFQNATFVDSQQTYTMRQAGMNLARQGQYAAQQTTMGNEASSIAYNGL